MNRKNPPKFPELEIEIMKSGKQKRCIAEEIGCTPSQFGRKLVGIFDFTLYEVKVIHKMFPDVPVEKLFRLDEE